MAIWRRMVPIKSNAEALRKAHDAGNDPIGIQLDESPAGDGKSGQGTDRQHNGFSLSICTRFFRLALSEYLVDVFQRLLLVLAATAQKAHWRTDFVASSPMPN